MDHINKENDRTMAGTLKDIYDVELNLSSEDQKYIAELRKFFELAIREVFLLIGQRGEENLDGEYVRKAISIVRRDEQFISAIIKDTLRKLVKRDFSDAPSPVTIYRDDEVVALIREEAQCLMSSYRRINTTLQEGPR